MMTSRTTTSHPRWPLQNSRGLRTHDQWADPRTDNQERPQRWQGPTKELRIDKSLDRAEERRERRRAALGVTIHYDYRAWHKLGDDKQAAFNARKQGLGLTTVPETERRWDFTRDFDDYTGKLDGAEHLNPLFRSGSANPPRHQRDGRQLYWRSWEDEGNSSRIVERRVWC